MAEILGKGKRITVYSYFTPLNRMTKNTGKYAHL